MKLDTYFFKKNCQYKNKSINRAILIIQHCRNERRVQAYKVYVFKMMKYVVRKNMYNYLNLLKSTNCRAIPDNDEVITDSYIIFDKCLEKYHVKKTNNFYFYFNKSLSRNFYKLYQKEVRNVSVEITETVSIMHPKLRTNEEVDTIEVILDNMKFCDCERRIIYSRLRGQKTSEFLEENPDITNGQYSRILRDIKEILTDNMEEFI